MSCAHASQWNFDRQKPSVWQRGNRTPRACSDCVSVRMRQAVSDAEVEAVTATICGATPLCSRGRTTTRVPAAKASALCCAGFVSGGGSRLRLRLGVRGKGGGGADL